jgi:hypothetical protein
MVHCIHLFGCDFKKKRGKITLKSVKYIKLYDDLGCKLLCV